MPEVAPSVEQIRAALDELLGWQEISRSPRLASLLSYVVEARLRGDEQSIKAYSIAVDVFGRAPSFDPQSDPIVRVQARRLRGLLDAFYDGEMSRSGVRISLPVGRYVPEFSLLAPALEGTTAGDAVAEPVHQPVSGQVTATGPTGWLPEMWRPIMLGFSLTLAGGALATLVLVQGLLFPAAPSSGPAKVPDRPRVTVGTVTNLTGDGLLDGVANELRLQLLNDLSHFETVVVVLPKNGVAEDIAFTVNAVVRRAGSKLEVNVLLTAGADGDVVWSTTLQQGAQVFPYATMVTRSASRISSLLAMYHGPLHKAGRDWMEAQSAPPVDATTYACLLQLYHARDTGMSSDAEAATACFRMRLASNPQDALALAANAELTAGEAAKNALSGDAWTAILFDEAQMAQRAVQLGANSSFTHEELARLQEMQGFRDDAAKTYLKALALNPANADARAAYGLMQALNGKWDLGVEAADFALDAVELPTALVLHGAGAGCAA